MGLPLFISKQIELETLSPDKVGCFQNLQNTIQEYVSLIPSSWCLRINFLNVDFAKTNDYDSLSWLKNGKHGEILALVNIYLYVLNSKSIAHKNVGLVCEHTSDANYFN